MINVKEWAFDNLPEDDVPLTEKERSIADELIKSISLIDTEPTRMVPLKDTSIEMLQHGLLLVREVLSHRLAWLEDHEEDKQYHRDVLDSLRNVRMLYSHLEDSKDQLPI